MCNVFAGQDPDRYRVVNRSVRIGGHSTSIQLENAFWEILDDMAEGQGLTTAKFMSTLHNEACERHGSIPNFASLLRTTCVLYINGARPENHEIAALRVTG